MRYLAIDYGARRLGLAVCDADETVASPHGVLTRQNLKADLQNLLQSVRGLNIDGIVFGLPRSVASGVGDSEKGARTFADALQNALNQSCSPIEIAWQDERFSTAEALKQMQRAGISQRRGRQDAGAQSTDARAAAIILQSFLDAKSAAGGNASEHRVLDASHTVPTEMPRREVTDLF